MKSLLSLCTLSLFIFGGLLVAAYGSCSAQSDEPNAARASDDAPRKRSTVAPNAAGIYWQAFAAIPNLKDEQKKTLDTATASTNAPFNDDVKPILAQYRVALHELHRARSVTPCDWQLDLAAGPELLLPHLQKARELSRVALLQARMRFAAGETEAAISDVLDVFKLGRDCGCQPILIAFLVNVAIEKTAAEVLAAHLPLLKPDQLDQLATSLRQLPETSTVASCIQWEERLFGDWLERVIVGKSKLLNDPNDGGKLLAAISKEAGIEVALKPNTDDPEAKRKAELLGTLTVADVRESLKRLRADYLELAAIATLPFAEQAPRLKTLEEGLNESKMLKKREDAHRYFSTLLLPAVSTVLLREEQFVVRQGLLEQAIRVQRHGIESLQPVRNRKVEHKKTTNGLELHCPVTNGEEVIVIGRAS